MTERERVLEQIDRLRQLLSLEKDAAVKPAIERLLKFYEAKLAVMDAAPMP